MCAVYGMPGNPTPEQLLYLSLNLQHARLFRIEQTVIASDIINGNPPKAWLDYRGVSATDQLNAQLLRMMQ
jgi:hypothetical protein